MNTPGTVLYIGTDEAAPKVLLKQRYAVRTTRPEEGLRELFRRNGSVCVAVIEDSPGMTVQAFLKTMRAHHFLTPVVAITDVTDAEAFADLDVFEFLSHPLSTDALIEAVSVCEQTYARFHEEVKHTSRHVEEATKDAYIQAAHAR